MGKTFDMSPSETIEKRVINRVQLKHVRYFLINKNNQDKNYYNCTNIYEIKEILGTNYLFSKKIKTSETSGRIVPLEDE